MENIYTVVDIDTSKELRAQFDIYNIAENEIAIIELRTEEMENPYFNFETKEFYNKWI